MKMTGVIPVGIFVWLFCRTSTAGATAPKGYGSGESTSIGIRLGWSGAPNGLTYRKSFYGNQAFEFVVGYNGKVGRTLDLPMYQRGNSFIGASYAPYFEMGNGGSVSCSINADIGARLRVHHYRPFGRNPFGSPVTPDLIAGGGMQLNFNDSVELFADLHMTYYNRYDNAYVPGVESGLGLRFVL